MNKEALALGQMAAEGLRQPVLMTRMMPTTKRGLKRYPDGIIITIPAWLIGFVAIPVMMEWFARFIDEKTIGDDIPDWLTYISPAAAMAKEGGLPPREAWEDYIRMVSPVAGLAGAAKDFWG